MDFHIINILWLIDCHLIVIIIQSEKCQNVYLLFIYKVCKLKGVSSCIIFIATDFQINLHTT